MSEHPDAEYLDRLPPPPRGERRTMVIVGLIGAGALLAMIVGFWFIVSSASPLLPVAGSPAPSTAAASSPRPPTASASPSASPSQTAPTIPPAPSSDQLTDGSWMLTRYLITPADGRLSVEATIMNLGSEKASTTARVFAYTDGRPVGVATAEITDVPAGQSVSVTMTSQDPWTTGPKVVSFQADTPADDSDSPSATPAL